MDNSNDPENINASLGKHLKAIAEQQKKQTEYLRNMSAVFTFLLIAIVLFLVIFSIWTGIL